MSIYIISEVSGQNVSPEGLAFSIPDDSLSHNLYSGLTGLVDSLSEHWTKYIGENGKLSLNYTWISLARLEYDTITPLDYEEHHALGVLLSHQPGQVLHMLQSPRTDHLIFGIPASYKSENAYVI